MLNASPLSVLVEGCGLSFPDHWREWENLLNNNPRLLLVASRDMGKSTLVSNFYPIEQAISKPGIQILIISYSEGQVMRIITGIKDLLENRDMLMSLVPEDGEDWSKSALRFKNGSKINSLTFGTSGRGGHYDLIIIDDPVKDYSGMDPEHQEDYFLRAIIPMARPDAQIIVTGTYVYPDDLIERIKRNKAYPTFEYPAINSDGEPLWPARWSLKKLQARRLEVGEYGFRREYLLEAIDPEAQFFKRSMFQFYDPNNLPERMSRVGSVDPAITTDGDDTAIIACGTGEDKKTRVLGYSRLRTDDISAIVERVFEMVSTWKLPYILFETIGFQKLFKWHLYEAMREKNNYFGIEEIKTHRKSKQARIMALQPRIVSGALLFHPTEQEELISQFLAFPRGQRDDLIDALSFQVGKWDKPDAFIAPAPVNSFEWWRQQVPEKSQDWKDSLNLT